MAPNLSKRIWSHITMTMFGFDGSTDSLQENVTSTGTSTKSAIFLNDCFILIGLNCVIHCMPTNGILKSVCSDMGSNNDEISEHGNWLVIVP